MSGRLFGRITLCTLKNRWIRPKIIGYCIRPESVSDCLIKCFSASSSKNMKLLQYKCDSGPCEGTVRVGFLIGDKIVDINRADPRLPTTLLEILKQDKLGYVKSLACKDITLLPTIPLSWVTLIAPITGMDKVLCVGLNYKDHCTEQKLTPPPVPMIFSKFTSTVIGPNEPVQIRTQVTQKVDWEVELAVVIGKQARFVKSVYAYEYVAGYTIAQDISARDWQKEKNAGQFLLGKAMDTFCPIGPWIVTTDEITAPEGLNIKCSVNGTMKQSSKTDQLVHKIPDIIERLSNVMTLLPGDIILTGTPGGVGMYRNPPEYLKPGDVILNEIENIGKLEVKITAYDPCLK